MVEKSDATSLVGRSNYELPEVRGRALVKLADVHVAQCYLPVEHENDIQYANSVGTLISEIAAQNTVAKATGVRILSDTVAFEELIPYFDTTKRTAWIGFDTETTEPLGLDLTIPYHLISGGSASGKTNLLRILLRQFTKNRIFISDSQAGDLEMFAKQENVTYMGSASDAEAFLQELTKLTDELKAQQKASGLSTRDFVATQPPALVLIDDGEAFISYTALKTTQVVQQLNDGGVCGICFIATSIGSKFKGFDAISGIFKSPQSGIVLGVPEEAAMHITGIRAPNHKPSPSIGFMSKRGDTKKIKFPFVKK